MKILYLMTQDLDSPTGVGRISPLARNLAERGHQVTVIALHPDFKELPPDQRRFTSGIVDVRYVAQMHVRKRLNDKTYFSWYQLLWITAWATWSLLLEALKVPADIIHISKPHPMNSIAGLIVGYLRRNQVWLDCDDDEAASGNFSGEWQRRVIAWFEQFTPQHVVGITTHTEYMQKKLYSWGLSPDRVYYLPNGVDAARFSHRLSGVESAKLRDDLMLGNCPVIIYVGSLSLTSHPLFLLLEAFSLVKRELPQSVLLCIGGGEDLLKLQTQANKLGINDAVRFVGRIPPDQVSAYYQIADVSVEPVYDDNAGRGRSPLKLFESWTCGVPFVSADVGERRKLISDPPAGLLAVAGNPSSFAFEILRVLREEELAAALRQRGLEQVKGYYWNRLAINMEKIYKKSLSHK